MTNLSLSIVNIIYNYKLLRIMGEDGVAAFGVIMYVNFIFLAIFIGYSIGSAPIIGYHYGAGNHAELKSLFKKSHVLILIAGIFLTVLAEVLAMPLSKIFVGYDDNLLAITVHGFRLFSISFVIIWFNNFSSGFITALINGFVSATISFLRTLVFQIICVIVLPIYFGIDGIWSAVIFAELLGLFVTIYFYLKKRKQYHYL